jgi:KDO2-lipid IV(A) lauroyltransferase
MPRLPRRSRPAQPIPLPETAPPVSTASPRLRHRLEYAGLALARSLIRLMPIDVASTVMGKAWRWIAPWLHRHPRAVTHIARAFPDRSAREHDALARAMWETLGRVAAEGFLIDRIADDPSRITLDLGPAAAAFEASRTTGAVVVSLHTGNWEIVALPARALGISAAGVYQRIANPLVEALLLEIRHPYYPGGLYPKGKDTVRAILSHIRKGGTIALLADHRDVRGLLIDFLGAPAWATRTPAHFARSFDVPLIIGRVIRTGPGARFRIEADVIDVPRSADRDSDIDTATLTINAHFERWIRERPTEWMWIHQRWQKPGDPAPERTALGGAPAAVQHTPR